MSKTLITALGIFTLLILFLMPTASAQAIQVTFKVMSSNEPLNDATVDWYNHSAAMTGDNGKVVFNVFPEAWPITVTVSCPGYISVTRTYTQTTVGHEWDTFDIVDDNGTALHYIMLELDQTPEGQANRTANSCCASSAVISCSVILMSTLIVVDLRKKEKETW